MIQLGYGSGALPLAKLPCVYRDSRWMERGRTGSTERLSSYWRTQLLPGFQVAFERDGADLGELRLHRVDHSSGGWKHAKCRKRAGVDDGLAVDQHLELSVASLDHVDVGFQFTTKTRRHPDGVQAGHSIGAIADGNPSHAD